MRIIYTLKLKQPNGQIEVTQKDFSKSELIIGRGGTCDILLQGPLISLQHAKIVSDGKSIFVEDLKSFGGTRVEGKLVGRQKLSKGDIISIGDSTFKVEKVNDIWNLVEYREPVSDPGEDVFVQTVVSRLDFRRMLPSYFILSLFISILLVIVFLLYPVGSGDMRSWSSGPVANVHRTFANDCTSCHQVPFERVPDQACLYCHNMTGHSRSMNNIIESHKSHDFRCGTCHMEHNDSNGLVVKDSDLCISCHSDLDSILSKPKSLNVSSFDLHPEFRITLKNKDGNKAKLSLAHLDSIMDPNTLKLNHKVHLEPELSSPDGYVTLSCDSCHQLSKDKKSFLPVTFKKDCESCHELSFEDFSKTIKVPHASPDVVFSALMEQYALLFLDKNGKVDEITNRSPVQSIPKGSIPRGLRAEYVSEKVLGRARKMEEQIFNALSCSVCHEVNEKQVTASLSESRYEITKPDTPSNSLGANSLGANSLGANSLGATWMPGAVFNHSSHQNVDCISCHSKARVSEKTSDVMMPQINLCQECHHDTGKGKGELPHDTRVVSTCVMCHVFHEAKPIEPAKRIRVNAEKKK
ncbi:MAG TPA: cytochrome c3 family protein [Oligoflexia bacterium]|nr:cytochrome c3 family protein [Oligoflexia bacterium]HMP47530.1 cytochrome c3 family protein [Oligoflexia bacterium]